MTQTAQKNNSIFQKIDIQQILDKSPLRINIDASNEDCKKVAQACDIIEVNSLNLSITLTKGSRIDLFRIQGKMKADIAQACGVTLTPIKEKIDDEFNELLTTSVEALTPPEEINGDDEQPVELIENNIIDLGEIICEWLILAMDPYPRTDVPEFQHIEAEETAEGDKTYKPFEILKDLKGK